MVVGGGGGGGDERGGGGLDVGALGVYEDDDCYGVYAL